MKVEFCILILFLQFLCHSIPFENKVFKKSIQTVFLKNPNSNSDLPILELNSMSQLTLHFDEISKSVRAFEYSFVKCTSEWEADQGVFTHDYIDGIETDQISDFNFSENTAVDYIHYSVSFPNNNINITMSGNYIVLVKDQETKEIILTRKLYIYENKVIINPTPKTPIDFEYRYTHQIINFNVDYTLINSDNPIEEFKAVVLQNGRYDNQKTKLNPQFVRGKELIFSDDSQNIFEGANEYRIIDFRDIKLKGRGISDIFFKDSIYHVIPNLDQKRAYLKYKSSVDHNGKFFIQSKPRVGDPNLTADYAFVHFRLKRRIPLDSSTVFLMGSFSGNEIKRENQMVYKDSLEHYESHVLMKQGVYDYAYTYRKIGTEFLKWEETDGSHFQTENIYTIFLYFKGFNAQTESLIGVKRFIFQ